MKYKQIPGCLLIFAILFGAQVSVAAQNVFPAKVNLSNEDVVLRWNRVLKETILAGAHPSATIFPVRTYAMMHLAMFDAVNSIDGGYTPYLTDVPGSKNASIDAAAAKAARDVLAGLYPSRTEIYDAELAASLEGIEPNRAQQGFRVGEIAAAQMLAARAADGWTVTLIPPYSLPLSPGNWQPASPQNAAATFTHYPAVLPFALTSNSQFAVPPPPALTSARYGTDFNEVKALGGATSATRTAEQAQIARLWAGVGTPTNPFLTWNNVARYVSIARNLSTVENARLFALFNMAVHDQLLTSFTGKFDYGLWRPVTAIRRADEDGNPATEPDATWLALVPNPPYPSYPGNMAGIGAAQSTMLALVFGRDDIAFEHTWEGAGGATRLYTSFTQMGQEQSDARIYGGIHYRFDNEAGQSVGRNVSNYVFLNYLRPR